MTVIILNTLFNALRKGTQIFNSNEATRVKFLTGLFIELPFLYNNLAHY